MQRVVQVDKGLFGQVLLVKALALGGREGGLYTIANVQIE